LAKKGCGITALPPFLTAKNEPHQLRVEFELMTNLALDITIKADQALHSSGAITFNRPS
jgi:hypothetical protein